MRQAAIAAGMRAAGQPCSGEFGFANTHVYWPITHMVAPAADALGCESCHAEDGRLADLDGLHMPGRTPFNADGILGLVMVLAALGGVMVHATLRAMAPGRGKEGRKMADRLVKVYPRFERFWHWAQMALIVSLIFTGLAINGLHGLIGFGAAVSLHVVAALALILLWVFAIFWHLTTGTWVHDVPTARGLLTVARFYAFGIFRGEHHPCRKAYWRKHNPLQAMAYLALKLVLFPAIWLTGLALLGWNLWETTPGATVWARSCPTCTCSPPARSRPSSSCMSTC